jgi:hypothetical protein
MLNNIDDGFLEKNASNLRGNQKMLSLKIFVWKKLSQRDKMFIENRSNI